MELLTDPRDIQGNDTSDPPLPESALVADSALQSDSSNEQPHTDQEYIAALKGGDDQIVHEFFYETLHYLVNKIRNDIFRNRVSYDELIGELYLYLQQNNWQRLDTYEGRNECRLRTWMIPVAWRFFARHTHRLLTQADMILERNLVDSEILVDDDNDPRMQMVIDIDGVLHRMSNQTYAQILRMLFIDGYKPKEVARKLGVTTDYVYVAKSRGIDLFIDLYNE